MMFVMQPGLVERDGHNYVKWQCVGCGRTEEWPAPYDMQPPNFTKSDIMEES